MKELLEKFEGLSESNAMPEYERGDIRGFQSDLANDMPYAEVFSDGDAVGIMVDAENLTKAIAKLKSDWGKGDIFSPDEENPELFLGFLELDDYVRM